MCPQVSSVILARKFKFLRTFVAFCLMLPSVGPIVGYALIAVRRNFRCLFLKLQLLDDFALDKLEHGADGVDDVNDHDDLDDLDARDACFADLRHWRPMRLRLREKIALLCYCNRKYTVC